MFNNPESFKSYGKLEVLGGGGQLWNTLYETRIGEMLMMSWLPVLVELEGRAERSAADGNRGAVLNHRRHNAHQILNMGMFLT